MIKNTVATWVNDHKTFALCDSGASISCVSEAFLNTAFANKSISLTDCNIKSIVGVGGTHHAVTGKVSLDIFVGKVGLKFHFYVIKDLHHSIILGLDFMETHNIVLDIKSKQMLIYGPEVYVCQLHTCTAYARTCKPVVLKANSEVDIQVKIARVGNEKQILLEPLPDLVKRNVMGARCLVKVKNGKAVLRLANPTDKNIFWKNNTILATVSEIDEEHVFCLDDENTHRTENQCKMSTQNNEHDDNLNFNLNDSTLSPEQRDCLLKLLHKNSNIFSRGPYDIGRTHLQEHKIELQENATPVRMPFYKQNPKMRRETEKILKPLLETGTVKESNSDWHSPVVLVRKSGSNEYRFAVDYRKLNKVTKPQAYPIPRLNDIFDAIGEAKAQYFTSLDMGKAFWQVPLEEKSKKLAAFITYDGIYEFQTMAFGLSGATATFQMLMMKLLRNIAWKYVLCYVDDIIIFSSSFEDHLSHLEEVFKRLRDAGLKLSPKKCFFAKERLHYLGFILSKDGVEADPRKVEKIVNLKAPKNAKGVKSLLGLTGFYKKFIPQYSQICSPLFSLLKKNNKFVWSEDCQKSLDKLKLALTSAPVLAFPDMSSEMILTCDASLSGLGYILGQIGGDKKEHVIEYSGRALHGAERNYTISELECLAVVEGVKAYKHYLATDIPFTIVTDHKALASLKTMTNSSNSRLARWALFLQGFNYKIVYRKGEQNQADALSRLTEAEVEEGTCINMSDTNLKPTTPCLTNAESCTDPANPGVTMTKKDENQAEPCENPTKSMVSTATSCISPEQPTTAGSPCYTQQNDALYHASNMSAIEQTDQTVQEESLQVTFEYETVIPVSSVDEPEDDNRQETIGDTEQAALADKCQLPQQQKVCPDFKDMYKYLATGELPEDDKQARRIMFEKDWYEIQDDILVHLYQPRLKKKPTEYNFTIQIALPRVQRQKLLKAYHDENGHQGIKRTHALIHGRYYWPRMYNDIAMYVKSCDICQRTKRNPDAKAPPLNPLPVADVFGRMHVDIIGPLTKSTEGYECILVAVDSTSKWVEAFPLRTQSAEEIAKIVHDEIFCRYGPPISIVTDRGANLLSKLISAICEIYQVARHTTSSYRPACNGAVERQNANIGQILRSYVSKHQKDWPLYLPVALMSLRSTPNTETSGYSAYEMLFGKQMRLSYDTTLVPRDNLNPQAKFHVAELIKRLRTIHEQAKENMEKAQAESKNRHDMHSKPSNFEVGEQVLLKVHKRTPGLNKKLEHKHTGPMYVREKGPCDTYKIADCQTDKIHKPNINARHLRKYYDPRDYRAPETDTDNEDDSDNENENHIPQEHATQEKQEQPKQNEQKQNRQNKTQIRHDQDEQNQTQQNGSQNETNEHNQEPDQDKWYAAKRVLKLRKKGSKREFLVEWADAKYKPSWQAEANVGTALIREFYITHNKQGKRRKRPIRKLKYFEKQ